VITFTPRIEAEHLVVERDFKIKAASPNFPLDTTESPFKTEGNPACVANSYTEFRLAIPL
jgi:hypothetical protein